MGGGHRGDRGIAAGREDAACEARRLPPLSRALTGGPGGPPGAERPEPVCGAPPPARGQAAPGRCVAAARWLQAGERCWPLWRRSHAATLGFFSFRLVLLQESVRVSFSEASWHHLGNKLTAN